MAPSQDKNGVPGLTTAAAPAAIAKPSAAVAKPSSVPGPAAAPSSPATDDEEGGEVPDGVPSMARWVREKVDIGASKEIFITTCELHKAMKKWWMQFRGVSQGKIPTSLQLGIYLSKHCGAKPAKGYRNGFKCGIVLK